MASSKKHSSKKTVTNTRPPETAISEGQGRAREKSVGGEGRRKKTAAQVASQSIALTPAVKAARQRALAAAARQRFLAERKRIERYRAGRAAKAKVDKSTRVAAAVEETIAKEQAATIAADIAQQRSKKIHDAQKLLNKRQRAFDRFSRKGGSIDTFKRLLAEVQAAQAELRIAQEGGDATERLAEAQKFREIKLGKELLRTKISDFYREQFIAGKVRGLSTKHASGKSWHVNRFEREGFVVDRLAGIYLDDTTIESLVYRMTKAAKRAMERVPKGKLYVSMSFFQYGKHVPKSSVKLGDDDLGTFYQSFDGTPALGDDVAGFEVKIRSILESIMLDGASENQAILMTSFQVKSYRERSVDEKMAFNVQRKKKGKKPIKEETWTKIR